jgi:hypothetical protein
MHNKLFEQVEQGLTELRLGHAPSIGTFSYRNINKEFSDGHLIMLGMNERYELSLWIGSKDIVKTPRVIWETRGIKATQSQDQSNRTDSWIVIETSSLNTGNISPSIFVSLASSICSKCIETKSTQSDIVRNALDEWREIFLGNPEGLGINELAGLIGELITLEEIAAVHGANALETWHGFEGERHDFSRKNYAIETKTKNSIGLDVSINGISQLEPPENGKLILRFLRLENAAINESNISIPYLVKSICQHGVSQGKLIENILKAKASIQQVSQITHCFKLIETSSYEVTDNFPRITPASFKNNQCPYGVAGIKYKINLGNTEPYKLENSSFLEFVKNI